MNSRPIDVIGEVINERKRQDDKWGEQNHSVGDWFLILTEELGEASEAALYAKFEQPDKREAWWAEYRKEIVEAAAVLVAMVEAFDRGKRRGLSK